MKKYAILVVLGLLGCAQRGRPAVAPGSGDVSEEPPLEIGTFKPLGEMVDKPSLPVLISADGRAFSSDCFESVRRPLVWQTGRSDVMKRLEQHSDEIREILIGWLEESIFRETAAGAGLGQHTVTFLKPTVANVPRDRIRFSESQDCLSGGARDFPMGSEVVSSVFGAKGFELKSRRPIERARIVEMKRAAAKKGMRLVPKNAYTPALDADGKPKRNEKKQKLFNSPTGELIVKKALPPPKERKVVEWKLMLSKPVYFAYGTLPKRAWRKTPTPSTCEVYLVFDDASPQVPKCTTFRRAGFGATRSKSEEQIRIRIANGSATATREIPWRKTTPVVVDGDMVVWVTPTPVEEGARLGIEALWLDVGDAEPRISGFSKDGEGKGRQHKKDDLGNRNEQRRPAPPPMGY